MSGVNQGPLGVLREGWSTTVADYAIAGGWSRGGELLVVADAAGGVHGLDRTSGATAWSQSGCHGDGLLALAFHPDGSRFATAGQDGRVLLWTVSGEVTHRVDVGSGWVEHLRWSPDGAWLAVTCSREVVVLDAEGAITWRSDAHPSTVSAIAWAGPDELATACYGQVSFFQVSTGETSQTLEWRGSLVSMVLSPDGDIVACGSQDNSVHFWRRSTGQDSMMSGYPGKPSALSFDDTGSLLATSGSPSVTVWNFAGEGPEGTRPGVLELHERPITALAFAPGVKKLASGARDGMVTVWSLNNDGDGGPIGAAIVGDTIASVAWRPDGRALAALDRRGGVTVWRVGQ